MLFFWGVHTCSAGWEVVSLDIVLKFEPTILRDIRSWDYTTFPGHFDMVWASPVCTEHSRADDAPRRLLEPLDVTYCKYGTPYRKQTRLWTNMRWRPRRSLCRPGSRHLRAAQRGPRLMEGQYEMVSQSRELLYSVPAALCEEIARAATEELAERLSIPD